MNLGRFQVQGWMPPDLEHQKAVTLTYQVGFSKLLDRNRTSVLEFHRIELALNSSRSGTVLMYFFLVASVS